MSIFAVVRQCVAVAVFVLTGSRLHRDGNGGRENGEKKNGIGKDDKK